MFALSKSPEGYKYPRIIRYGALESNLLATLDREFNLLSIDKEKFDRLTPEDQETLMRTHEEAIYCYTNRSGVTKMVRRP